MVILAVFSTIENGVSTLTFLPLFFIPILVVMINDAKKLKKTLINTINMSTNAVITNTIHFVKTTLKNAEGGHDWFHIERVFKNAILICKDEKADVFVVSLAALLHDIADSKFNNGDETVGPKIAAEF
jgi:Predicted HD superfamily hydrolase